MSTTMMTTMAAPMSGSSSLLGPATIDLTHALAPVGWFAVGSVGVVLVVILGALLLDGWKSRARREQRVSVRGPVHAAA